MGRIGPAARPGNFTMASSAARVASAPWLHSPFAVDDAATACHRHPAVEEALGRLHFLVESGRRLGLLLAPHGCGKSLVLDVLAEELAAVPGLAVRVDLRGLDLAEWLAQWGRGLRAWPRDTSPAALRAAIAERLAEYRWQHLPLVLLADNLDAAEGPVVTELVRLADGHAAAGLPLTIVVTATRSRLGGLDERLLDLVELRVDLGPWELAETQGFVAGATARRRSGPAFSTEAVASLHRLSGGVPRHVRQLADLSWLAAAGQQRDAIDRAMVEACYEELAVARGPSGPKWAVVVG